MIYKQSRQKWLAVVLALSALAISLFASSSASADTVHYYGSFLQPGQSYAYPGGAFPGVYYNIARYEGAGTVSVCEKATTQGGTQKSRRCANNVVDSASDLYFNSSCDYFSETGGIWLIPYLGNNSGNAHTINGDFITHCAL